MTQGTVSSKGNCLPADGSAQREAPLFTVMSTAEFREQKDKFFYHKELMHSLGSIRYCKAEAFRDCIIGTFRLPQKKEQKTAALTFGFYLTEQSIIFIEDASSVGPWIEKHAEMLAEPSTPEQLLLSVLEQMTEDDMLYLLHIEAQAEKMEEDIAKGTTEDFFQALTKHRQKLSELNAYYEQLADIGELFQSRACRRNIQSEQAWDKFTHRAERLQGHVHLLRENMLQLRELYQSVQDARQNRTMGILTIVTTFFLPLTLLTGWYGMNFAYMPELKWRYGYVTVIVAALLIAIGEFIYFKKKKFF